MTADSNLTPETTSIRVSAEVEHAPLLLRSGTVIYQAATQCPAVELFWPFILRIVTTASVSSASVYLGHFEVGPVTERWLSKHIVNLCLASSAVKLTADKWAANRSCKHAIRGVSWP